MSVTIKMDHKSRMNIIDIGRSKKKIGRGIRKALFEMGRETVKTAKKYITRPFKTGRFYKIKKKIHQASAPGESPANLTGALRKSIHYKVRGHKEMEFGANTPYAAILELGGRVSKNVSMGRWRVTKVKAKILPRPYLRRAVIGMGIKNRRTLATCIDEELKRREARGYRT